MHHLEVHHKFGILVLEGMVAMRGRNKDFLPPVIDKSLDIFSGQASEYFLIARLADAFSTATLFDAQYPEIHSRLVKKIGCGLSHFLSSWGIAAIAGGEV